MKLCFIIHSLGIGGMERVVVLLANYIAGKGNVQVNIILIGKERKIDYNLNSKINIHKPNFEFDASQRSYYAIKMIFFLRKKVKEIRPTYIISFGEYWNNLAILSVLGLKMPIFICDRSEPGKKLGSFHNALRNWLYPKANALIVQTKVAKQLAERKRWNKRVFSIGNPVRKIEKDISVRKENIILSIGRFIPTKNFDHLIKIFNEVNNGYWKLVIVGGNAKNLTLWESTKDWVAKMGWDQDILLPGEVKEIDQFYKQAKIFAFTSSSEGFPNVIGEAMSAGLPVIAYDCMAGPSEMITDSQDGFLIPLFNDEVFKEKLELLMNKDVQREEMGKMAVKNIRRFDVEQISKKFLQVILTKD